VSPPRVLLVTRRFWPLVGSAERVMGQLAVELAARGWKVTVLTAQWNANWPAGIFFQGVPVVRLPHRHGGIWDAFRNYRRRARWLRAHQDDYDVVCVSSLREEAYSTLKVLGGRVPVVLRAETAGRRGDCMWQIEVLWGRSIKRQCMKAAALVAPTRVIERQLQAAGYPRARIHYVPYGVPPSAPRTAETQAQARAALGEANPSLILPEGVPVALYAGPLRADRGLTFLIAAWERVVAHAPDARLWLAGEGPDQRQLERQIDAARLANRVILAGVFEQIDPLLAAADLVVQPALESGSTLAVLEAMAAGLPVVGGDVADLRDLITEGQEGLLVSAEEPLALASAVLRIIRDSELAARLGEAARRRAADLPLAKMVDSHVTLFQNLLLPNA